MITFLLNKKKFFLAESYYDSEKFGKLDPQKRTYKIEKMNVYDTASGLYTELLGIYFDGYYDFFQALKEKR